MDVGDWDSSIYGGKRFYIMRHANTAPLAKRQEDDSVLQLSNQGKEEALDAVGKVVALVPPPTRIITSGKHRTRHTAMPAAEALGLEMEADPLLNENDLDCPQDLTTQAQRDAWRVEHFSPEQESSEQQRNMQGLTRHLQKKGIPLFVGHNTGMRHILRATLGESIANTQDYKTIPTCGILEFITPEHAGAPWQVNVVTVDNGQLCRRPFGSAWVERTATPANTATAPAAVLAR